MKHVMLLGIVGMTLATLPSSSAAAQGDRSDMERARELYDRAAGAYGEGSYERALALLRESYELSGRPALLLNMASTLERLGRPAEAVHTLEQYLPHATSEEAPALELRILNLRNRATALEQQTERRIEAEAGARSEAERRTDAASGAPGPDLAGPLLMYAATLAAAGAGIALAVVDNDTDQQAVADYCMESDRGIVCDRAVQGDLDTASGLALGADLSFGLAAVLAVAGTAWLIVSLTAGGEEERLTEAGVSALHLSPLSAHVVHRF